MDVKAGDVLEHELDDDHFLVVLVLRRHTSMIVHQDFVEVFWLIGHEDTRDRVTTHWVDAWSMWRKVDLR